jgi:SAM-dependent methyltransferase
MKNTETVFRESEFTKWAYLPEIYPSEKFVVQKYLNPEKTVLEGGAGGGRILFAMQAIGFKHLNGFDLLPEFVEAARKRDQSGKINYQVQDGRSLKYSDSSFEQLIYLQQLISLISEKSDREKLIIEAYRVLKPGGVFIINLLCTRSRGSVFIFWNFWLKFLRLLSFRKLSLQNQPWLRLKGKPNLKALIDFGPYVYWFQEDEAAQLLLNAGFKIEFVGSEAQTAANQMQPSQQVPASELFSGSLYLICRKPL